MAEMGPREYANNYWEMDIPIINDDNNFVKNEKVQFNKYRLHMGWGSNPVVYPPGLMNFLNVIDTYAAKLFRQEKPIFLMVKNVWGENNYIYISTMNEFKKMHPRAAAAFSGKGSPEDVQLTLQLAARCGLAPDGLQKYCDETVDSYARLGLDCNGFVGNYLMYRNSNTKWSLTPPKTKIDSTTMIRDMLTNLGTKLITNVDDMMNHRIFVMGLVDSAGTVINQLDSNGRPGHVVITEPVSWGKRPVYPPVPKEYLIPDARYLHYSTIESTPGVGLSAGVYAILNMTKSGVATVFRGNIAEAFPNINKYTMNVKIYPMI